jgi:hypothetical protein
VNFKSNHSKRHRRGSIHNEQIQDNSNISPELNISIKEKTITGHGIFHDLALFIGILLLLLHIYLCYKLYSLDQTIPTPEAICFNRCIES